jgi:hypothetical protein
MENNHVKFHHFVLALYLILGLEDGRNGQRCLNNLFIINLNSVHYKNKLINRLKKIY